MIMALFVACLTHKIFYLDREVLVFFIGVRAHTITTGNNGELQATFYKFDTSDKYKEWPSTHGCNALQAAIIAFQAIPEKLHHEKKRVCVLCVCV